MTEQITQVMIIDDGRREQCDIGCGIDWSVAETLALASEQIKSRFGNKIALTHLNPSQPATGPDTRELNRKIKEQNLSLPLLLINGHPRISGDFDIRQMLDAIEAELEIVA